MRSLGAWSDVIIEMNRKWVSRDHELEMERRGGDLSLRLLKES